MHIRFHGGDIPHLRSGLVFGAISGILAARSVRASWDRQNYVGGADPRFEDSTMVGQAKIVDRLRELARNLWWTWQPSVINLFRDLDPILWRTTDHNPIEFLKKISTE